jgi:hypothetical protein
MTSRPSTVAPTLAVLVAFGEWIGIEVRKLAHETSPTLVARLVLAGAAMTEFILRGDPDDEFDLGVDRLVAVLLATGRPHRTSKGFGQTNLEVELDGYSASFSPEPVGWQFSIRSPIPADEAQRLAEDVCKAMSQVSGQVGTVIPI